MAYLTMIAVRLIELHRVLKPTGSLYLPALIRLRATISKVLLDSIFRPKLYINEIV